MIDKPGFYPDMPANTYFADPCSEPSFTQSLAKILLERSPLHAHEAHPRLTTRPETEDTSYRKELAIGNAAHSLLLERGKEVVVIKSDDFRNKSAQIARDTATSFGHVPILEKHYATAATMAASARMQLDGVGVELAGTSEIVIAWQERGLWCRSMIDLLSTDLRTVIDYKTTGMNCAPHALARKLEDDGFDIQAAFHERGLNALDPDGRGRRRHLFICQENESPYALTVAQMTESVMTIGRKKVTIAMARWHQCMTTGQWPSYPSEIIYPEYPGYAESRWLDREQTEFADVSPDYLMAG